MPERILDLFVEFRARTNGVETPAGNGLLGALTYFGLDGMGAAEKEEMRAVILRGGPWTEDERTAILDYCEGDVDGAGALVAGHAAADRSAASATARPLHGRRRGHGTRGHADRRRDAGAASAPLDGHSRSNSSPRSTPTTACSTAAPSRPIAVRSWLAANNIPWPLLESGRLDLSDDTFRQQAPAYPAVSPLRELRSRYPTCA